MSIPISGDTLPRVSKHAIWHPRSGLVVSPFSRELPDTIADRAKPIKTRDWHLPRLLGDADIYLAFYPRRLPHSDFFAALALSPDELEERIVPLKNDLGFMLDAETMDAWIDIEDSLISIIGTLMETHEQKEFFPHITWPHWPEHTGYRDWHLNKEAAFKSVRYAKRAFIALSACATFAISLWLGQNEYFCFNRAWDALTNRKKDPIPRPFLDSLQDSIVCNLESGFRPGGFISPYLTRWGRFMPYFVRARVPIWFVWGNPKDYYTKSCVEVDMRRVYFPPEEVIGAAQERQLVYTTTILPHSFDQAITTTDETNISRSGPPIHLPNKTFSSSAPWQTVPDRVWTSNENPPPPFPVQDSRVQTGSGQRSGESWEEFSGRMKSQYTRWVANETDRERMSRLSREKYAEEQRLSKTCKVWAWEKDDFNPTFYCRTYVTKDSAPSIFADYYPHQRIYWGHRNEWDLVPFIPPPPGVVVPGPYEEDDDGYSEDYEGIGSYATMGIADRPNLNEKIQNATSRMTATESVVTLPPPTTPSLREYLLSRHGFTCSESGPWDRALHVRSRDAIKASEAHKALGVLLFNSESADASILTSVVNCLNVVRNSSLTYTHLTYKWDIRWDLRLNIRAVNLLIADKDGKDVYILRAVDFTRWNVALSSSTAVLLVYRKGWTTTSEICRGLLELGVPFRTVIESTHKPPVYNWKQESRGLGIRPKGYKMTRWDYDAYLKTRNATLTSSTGRAIRLRGGLVGRIAAEVVPDVEVLDGPILGDEVVAQARGSYFLDDGVTDETLDRICGVYHVYVDNGSKDVVHESWWPKHDIFMASGRFSDQWLPDSEDFYKKRMQILSSGIFDTKSSSQWRSDLKFKKVQSMSFINGSEQLARIFLAESSRAR